jgi:hypothetical protein
MTQARLNMVRGAVALAALFSFAARADGPAKAEAPKKKVLRLDEFTVEGRIQKPQAFFILQRSNLSFEDPDKKETFLPKIVKTCEKDPF